MYSVQLLQQVKDHLKQGGIIAYPTEYCFGLGCDPFNDQAVRALIKLKQRDIAKGLIIIAAQFSQLRKIIAYDSYTIDEFNDYWPGANTLILKVNPNYLLHSVLGNNRGIAVRVTKNQNVIQLCNHLQLPLISTSANRSSVQPAITYKECLAMFGKEVLCLPGNTDFAQQASRIIDWHDDKRIIRQ